MLHAELAMRGLDKALEGIKKVFGKDMEKINTLNEFFRT